MQKGGRMVGKRTSKTDSEAQIRDSYAQIMSEMAAQEVEKDTEADRASNAAINSGVTFFSASIIDISVWQATKGSLSVEQKSTTPSNARWNMPQSSVSQYGSPRRVLALSVPRDYAQKLLERLETDKNFTPEDYRVRKNADGSFSFLITDSQKAQRFVEKTVDPRVPISVELHPPRKWGDSLKAIHGIYPAENVMVVDAGSKNDVIRLYHEARQMGYRAKVVSDRAKTEGSYRLVMEDSNNARRFLSQGKYFENTSYIGVDLNLTPVQEAELHRRAVAEGLDAAYISTPDGQKKARFVIEGTPEGKDFLARHISKGGKGLVPVNKVMAPISVDVDKSGQLGRYSVQYMNDTDTIRKFMQMVPPEELDNGVKYGRVRIEGKIPRTEDVTKFQGKLYQRIRPDVAGSLLQGAKSCSIKGAEIQKHNGHHYFVMDQTPLNSRFEDLFVTGEGFRPSSVEYMAAPLTSNQAIELQVKASDQGVIAYRTKDRYGNYMLAVEKTEHGRLFAMQNFEADGRMLKKNPPIVLGAKMGDESISQVRRLYEYAQKEGLEQYCQKVVLRDAHSPGGTVYRLMIADTPETRKFLEKYLSKDGRKAVDPDEVAAALKGSQEPTNWDVNKRDLKNKSSVTKKSLAIGARGLAVGVNIWSGYEFASDLIKAAQIGLSREVADDGVSVSQMLSSAFAGKIKDSDQKYFVPGSKEQGKFVAMVVYGCRHGLAGLSREDWHSYLRRLSASDGFIIDPAAELEMRKNLVDMYNKNPEIRLLIEQDTANQLNQIPSQRESNAARSLKEGGAEPVAPEQPTRGNRRAVASRSDRL